MDRVSKVNLLLEYIDRGMVCSKLRESHPGTAARHEDVLVYEGEPHHPSAPEMITVEARHYHDQILQQIQAAKDQRRALLKSGGSLAELEKTRQELVGLQRRRRDGRPLQAGDFLSGRYELVEKLGSGGFATVWKALDEESEELVALKILHNQHVDDQSRRARFFKGAAEMARLNHPNIVRVLRTEVQDGPYYYFVMEHVAGRDFRRLILDGGISQEQVVRMIHEIGEALQYAHERNVFHRDVKPANILVRGNGSACLTDFDLVRVADSTGGTRTGPLGTFIYAAPEALDSGKDADACSDVFSLGMTALFGMYGRDLPLSALRGTEAFVAGLACAKKLKSTLVRAVEWDRALRYQRVAEFCRDLARACLDAAPEDVQQVVSEPAEVDLSILQGLWRDTEHGILFMPRLADGELRIPYGDGSQLGGHIFNCRLIGRKLHGQYHRFSSDQLGYVQIDVESPERITISLPQFSARTMGRLVCERVSSSPPRWAEDYFSERMWGATPVPRIRLVQGNIAHLAVDAIVCAESDLGIGMGDVASVIHHAAGPALMAERLQLGICPVGGARLTRGYLLPARFVIHTVGPTWSGAGRDATQLGSCYRQCLKLAVDHGVETIAFPAISCGGKGYPARQASSIAVREVLHFLPGNASIQQVIFVCYAPDVRLAYLQALGMPNDLKE